jgi:transposase
MSDVNTTQHTAVALVAIDIAKRNHDVAILWPNGKTATMKIANSKDGFQRLMEVVQRYGDPVHVAFEPTADYHRNLAYWLQNAGATCFLVSSLMSARARELLFKTWDKNDRKDAQVILYLMRQNMMKPFYDPLVEGTMDIQELSNTYHQISLARTRCQHSLINHYLTLYFPEMERFYHASRSEWFCRFLCKFPTPQSITRYKIATFVKRAWVIVDRKVAKQRFLEEVHETACRSIGLPVELQGQAVKTFRIQLQRIIDLNQLRHQLEKTSENILNAREDYQQLRSVPGVGPICAMMIIAESGDLNRVGHYRQYLNFCGFNLCSSQSGQRQSKHKISKRGNSRLRYAYWLAATIAIRQRENSFREKYERHIKSSPNNPDLKRKAVVAIACKLARVCHSLVKQNTPYRGYYEFNHGT